MAHPPRRWENDERGRGIGDGRSILPALDRLRDALVAPAWVAEGPEHHLLPHLRRACDAPASPWTLVGVELRDAVYVVELTWAWSAPRLRDVRTAAFALVGAVAENASFVRRRLAPDRVEYAVATGMLDGDAPFAAHGHLLLLRSGGPAIAPILAGAGT